jgi:hypothetical protein
MATAIEKVRLLIGDTGSVQFIDDQILIFLDMASNSILLAASYALEAWAASLTDSLTSERIGDYAYTKKSVDDKMALAKKYREEDASSPYLTWAEMNLTGETE